MIERSTLNEWVELLLVPWCGEWLDGTFATRCQLGSLAPVEVGLEGLVVQQIDVDFDGQAVAIRVEDVVHAGVGVDSHA